MRWNVTTILTLLFVAAWMVMALIPGLENQRHVLDALMPVVVGFWFLPKGAAKNGDKAA